MNICRRYRESLGDLLDGTLAPALRDQLQAHLDQCPGCRQGLEDLKRTLDRIRALEPVEPPPWLAERILARARAQAPGPGRLARLLARPALPAAALVLLCLGGYLVTRVAAPRPLPSVSSLQAPPAPPAPGPPQAGPPAPSRPPSARAAKRLPAPSPEPAAGIALEPQAAPAPPGAAAGAAAGQDLEGAQPRYQAKAEAGARLAAHLEPVPAEAGDEGAMRRAPGPGASRDQIWVFRLTARDPRAAGPLVEAAFHRAGATILAPPAPGRPALSARVPGRSLPALLDQLEALGTLDGERPGPAAPGAEREVAVSW